MTMRRPQQNAGAVSLSADQLRAHLTPEFVERYNVRGPRYTSYPAAPYWTPAFDGDAWKRHLTARAAGDGREGSGASPRPLSLYVHIPFCQRHCHFCACNVIITEKEGIAGRYLDAVEQEVELVARLASTGREVVQLHLGGGTPNYLTGDEMARLMAILRGAFTFAEDAEVSIEVDPRISSPEEIERLAKVDGFNRISFGAQDFDEETQEAIGRSQTWDVTRRQTEAARANGFSSVNLDLIYGLPRQTIASWRETIDRFLDLRPDRLALYNFAYLPERVANQRHIDERELPCADDKLTMFLETNARLLEAGYRFIGLDHYALEGDTLTAALDDGSLRRNFMGYTTLLGTDLLGFGVSAISDFEGVFTQSTKILTEYERLLDERRLPTERGLALSTDDERRRYLVERIMCAGNVREADYAARYGEGFAAAHGEELERLAPLATDGLVVINNAGLYVTPMGRFFLRNVAMVFDAYLPKSAPIFNGEPLPVSAPAPIETKRAERPPTFSRTM
jgi:oxygen-independent coproporphyrinogen-3 oxidase